MSVQEVLQILGHSGGHRSVLLGHGDTYALSSPTSMVWGAGPVLAVEFLGSSPRPIHQPPGPEWASTPSHISMSTVNAGHCPPPPPCSEPRPHPPATPGKWEAGNLIKSLLYTTWDTVDSSNRKNFKNFQGEQVA